ncbi:MAG: gliding motility-associated-like protein, partial [Saprospiraceae bacterium]
DPLEVGVEESLLQNTEGCDSLVITTTSFLESDTTYVPETSCDLMEVGVEESLLQNTEGCDSLVITTTSFLESDTTYVPETSCDPLEVGVVEMLLQNTEGCDSLVVTTTSLLQSDTTYIPEATCNPDEVGLENIFYENQNGCDSIVVITTVLLPLDSCAIEVDLLGITLPCSSDEGTLSLTVTLGQGPFSYEWEGGTGTNPLGSGMINVTNETIEIDGLGVGDYFVTVSSNNGISVVQTASITQDLPPEIELLITTDYNGFSVACSDGENGGAAVTILNGGVAPFSYSWSNGESLITATSLLAGWNYVSVTDAAACVAMDSVFLDAPPPLILDWEAVDESCPEAGDGIIIIDTIYGGSEPYSLALDGGLSGVDTIFENLLAGVHELTVQDVFGCVTSEPFVIEGALPIFLDLGPDTTIQLGESIRINAQTNLPLSALDTVLWESEDGLLSCDFCLEQLVQPLFTNTYEVMLVDSNGCVREDVVIIEVRKSRDVYIPNAFSPNGDGVNDRFTLYAGAAVKNVRSLLIYDRWGAAVFKANDFLPSEERFGWDGFFRGKLVSPGVYVYWTEVAFLDGEVLLYKGEVVVVD